MAIISEFRCYICGRQFEMAYGGLFHNNPPNERSCVCPNCKDKHDTLQTMEKFKRLTP